MMAQHSSEFLLEQLGELESSISGGSKCLPEILNDFTQLEAGRTPPRPAIPHHQWCYVKMVNTRDLLLDYIKYRLENRDYNVYAHENHSVQRLFAGVGYLTASKQGKTIRELGKKIDQNPANKIFLEKPIADLDLASETVRSDYFDILDELFMDKTITWGRLALVIVFTAQLAEKAMDEEEYEKIGEIVDWCCQYFIHNLFEEWILASGGWDALPPLEPRKSVKLIRVPDRRTVCFSALAFLSALGLGFAMAR